MNKKGLGLVEVMISTALLGAISLGVSKLMQTASKGVTHTKQDLAMMEIVGEIKDVLSQEEACLNTFFNGVPSAVPGAGFATLANLKDKGDSAQPTGYNVTKLAPGSASYRESDSVGIKEMDFGNFQVYNGLAFSRSFELRVTFERGRNANSLKNTYGSKEVRKIVKVIATLDTGGLIKSCHTVGKHGGLGDGIWTITDDGGGAGDSTVLSHEKIIVGDPPFITKVNTTDPKIEQVMAEINGHVLAENFYVLKKAAGVPTKVFGFGQFNEMFKFANSPEIGLTDDDVIGFGWCDEASCPTFSGKAHVGIQLKGGDGEMFDFMGKPDAGAPTSIGVATSGNFYPQSTNLGTTTSPPLFVAYGEHAQMMKDADAMGAGIPQSHRYTLGWCSHCLNEAGNPVLHIGALVPDGTAFGIYPKGLSGTPRVHLGARGAVASAGNTASPYLLGIGVDREDLMGGVNSLNANPVVHGSGGPPQVFGFYVDSGTNIKTEFPTAAGRLVTQGIEATGNVDINGGNLNVNGTIFASGTITSSDRRIKKNIKTLKNTLDKLKSVRGVSYKLKNSNEQTVGVIAQEIEKAYPDLVKVHNGVKGVNYNGLVGVLLQAIKDQQQIIIEGRARMKKNEERIKNLENENRKILSQLKRDIASLKKNK